MNLRRVQGEALYSSFGASTKEVKKIVNLLKLELHKHFINKDFRKQAFEFKMGLVLTV
ncbi:hypothetical protein X924_07380 [Petrotoga sp. 9PWA.NaAc.5.4]|nr:hypothetical protein X924_07380 [Petrotoga sp. 9PWA.NaAc.5.4]